MMRRFRQTFVLVLLTAVLMCGCVTPVPTATPMEQRPTASPTRPAPPSPAARAASATSAAQPTPTGSLREIIILTTNDEHGNLLSQEDNGFIMGGALAAATMWTSDGYDPTDSASNTLLLSGGDNWTGEAISTWFEGESTIEMMNAMGYRASVLGNHEFDNGQEVLRQREEQADFRYLAANVFGAKSNEVSDLAQPYLLTEVNGVTIGIVGLALESTPNSTAARGVTGLSFGAYEPALRKWVPVVRDQGAEIVIVLTHICPMDLSFLAKQVDDLDVDLFFGGHCHEARLTSVGSALVGTSSAYWEDYVWTRLVYDTAKGEIVAKEQRLEDVVYMGESLAEVPPELDRIAGKWQARTDTILGEVIGYTSRNIGQHSQAMHNLLVNAWLWAYDDADLAVSNTGGYRQDITSGDITLEDMVGVFPFDNSLVDMEVSGAEVREVLNCSYSKVVSGLRSDGHGGYVLTDGRPLRDDDTYHLLTTDYMWGNNKCGFKSMDAQPYDTSIHWRQPAIDWIKAQHSSQQRPLNEVLDTTVYP